LPLLEIGEQPEVIRRIDVVGLQLHDQASINVPMPVHQLEATRVEPDGAVLAADLSAIPADCLRGDGQDLVKPEVDFVGLARAFGVEASRITEAEALSEAVRESLSAGKPRLLDVAIAR
jgi:hypothetical protein